MPRPRAMTYRQIADDLRSRIERGEEGHRPGDKLPTYRALAEMYSVSVATAERTYAVLSTLGLVYGESGRGVYVAEQATPDG